MRRTALTLSALALLALTAAAPAQRMPREDVVDVPAMTDGLCVSNLFQSHMVVQRDKPIAIWGWAEPGETVRVTFGEETVSAKAGADRAWKVELAPRSASSDPATITVRGQGSELVLDDVLIGDVWVLGGQSNMEFEVAKVENGNLEIVSANYPAIRILTVPQGEGPEVTKGFARLHEWSDWFGRHFRKGDWDVCRPEVVRELSAIGWAFARRVHMASQVPIGVIDASRGGTTAETWTPDSVLRGMESATVKAKLADWDQRVADWDAEQDLANRVKQHNDRIARLTEQGQEIPANQREEPTDLRPGPIADHNLPGSCYAGMIAPLAGLSVKGAIFHQGYNNAFDGMTGVAMYRDVLPAMIEAWRAAFGDPELPFGILSLCTDGYPQTLDNYVENMLNTGIYIRAVQYELFRQMRDAGDENIGFASTYDLRRRWYHPQVKLPAGERIARWALATECGFGRELRWEPPKLLGMEAKDGALHLQLDADVSDPEDGAISGFAIAGEDRRFQPADVAHLEIGKDDRGQPRLDRKQLVLTSPLVPEPVHFRYAWGRNPLANLQAMSNLDLPFATQRSDDWDMLDVPLGVIDEKMAQRPDRAQMNHVRGVLRQEDERRRVDEARRVIEAHEGAAGGRRD
jgi:sialate O-acetylesterase